MQAEPGNRFQDRLNLLERTRAVFSAHQSLQGMSLKERKRICCTGDEDEIKWRLFGSMAGNPALKKRIADNDYTLSRALDLIPSSGPVTKEHYDNYIATLRQTFIYKNQFQGLAVATRLLCIKRPDVFLCIDGKNKSGLAIALGLSKGKIRIDTYWDSVIAPILESPWNLSAPPTPPTEKQAWGCTRGYGRCTFFTNNNLMARSIFAISHAVKDRENGFGACFILGNGPCTSLRQEIFCSSISGDLQESPQVRILLITSGNN